MMVAGLGAASRAAPRDILAALEALKTLPALLPEGARGWRPDALAVPAGARFEAAARQAAHETGCPLLLVPPALLQANSAGCRTCSERALSRWGVPSAAEAAALAGAGWSACLAVPRIVRGCVTVAVAVSPVAPPPSPEAWGHALPAAPLLPPADRFPADAGRCEQRKRRET